MCKFHISRFLSLIMDIVRFAGCFDAAIEVKGIAEYCS